MARSPCSAGGISLSFDVKQRTSSERAMPHGLFPFHFATKISRYTFWSLEIVLVPSQFLIQDFASEMNVIDTGASIDADPVATFTKAYLVILFRLSHSFQKSIPVYAS